MGAILNLPLGKIICSKLNLAFPLLLDPPGKGLSDKVSFSDPNLCVSHDVPSNLAPLCHCTAMDSFVNPNPNQTIPLDNNMVQDKFYHSNVARDLSLIP